MPSTHPQDGFGAATGPSSPIGIETPAAVRGYPHRDDLGQAGPADRAAACDVGQHLNEQHEQWLREQYLRDLATLDRIEHQNECFFDAMGRIHRQRRGDSA